MHYKNGRPVKQGDKVIGRGGIIGTVVALSLGATTCNIQVCQKDYTPVTEAQSNGPGQVICGNDGIPVGIARDNTQYGTAGDFLHADDAQKIIEEVAALAPETQPPVEAAPAPVASEAVQETAQAAS